MRTGKFDIWHEIAVDSRLSMSEKCTMMLLAEMADDNGQCWPSISTIAERAVLKERQAQRIIKSLIDQGYLSRAWTGEHKTPTYTLHVSRPEQEFDRGGLYASAVMAARSLGVAPRDSQTCRDLAEQMAK